MKKLLAAICALFVFCAFLPAASDYPDKPAALKKLMQDLLKAEKDGGQQKLKAFWDELKVPNPDQWFVEVFGERFGSPMAKTYTSQLPVIGKTLDKALSNALRDKMTQIDVIRFDRTCDSEAGDYVYPLLAARQKQQALYEAKLANGSYWTELFAFATWTALFDTSRNPESHNCARAYEPRARRRRMPGQNPATVMIPAIPPCPSVTRCRRCFRRALGALSPTRSG